jgi:hypothetical protein
VQEYHAYIMGSEGHILKRINLFCANGEGAKERAKQLVDGHDVELWQSDRQVAVYQRDH